MEGPGAAEREEDDVGAEVGFRQPGHEPEREPADHEQDRIRDPNELSGGQERRMVAFGLVRVGPREPAQPAVGLSLTLSVLAEAEDAVQDAFVNIWNKAASFDPK